MNGLSEKNQNQNEPSLNQPRVLIVGAGACGTTAGYEIRKRLDNRVHLTLVESSTSTSTSVAGADSDSENGAIIIGGRCATVTIGSGKL